jgi:hypothetical protein
MDRKYDLFEKFSDGSLLWKGTYIGHNNAIEKLQNFAATTENECFLMHLPDKAIVASMNVASESGSKPNS